MTKLVLYWSTSALITTAGVVIGIACNLWDPLFFWLVGWVLGVSTGSWTTEMYMRSTSKTLKNNTDVEAGKQYR